MMRLSCFDLRCDGLVEPICIDADFPRLSWKVRTHEHGLRKTSHRIIVYQEIDDEQIIVWDSGTVVNDELYQAYAGAPLESKTLYRWSVSMFFSNGAHISKGSIFETAFLSKTCWKAVWIEPQQEPAYDEPVELVENFREQLVELSSVRMNPTQIVRKSFTVKKQVKRARAYVTAHGVYFFELNGIRVGNALLAPEFTSYTKYLEYQVYDISNYLVTGENGIGFVLGDGWYRGKVGMPGGSCQFGDKLALLFQLELYYTDGTGELVCSDATCRSHEGPIRYSDLFVGEKYDENYAQTEFSKCGFDDHSWQLVDLKTHGYDNLHAQRCTPIRILERIPPKEITRSPKGETILDVGFVTAGFLCMRMNRSQETETTLEYSETLDSEGNFFVNIQGKFTHQTDIFIQNRARPVFMYEPSFTYHGFRYVKITGYPGIPSISDFDVCIIGSDLKKTGTFQCSDERLNKLQSNIFRSQRSNMISIPTDCPQREKQGWTGDAHIFLPTASFNMDMEAFFIRWLRSMRADQLPDGQIPYVIPHIKAYSPGYFPRFDTYTSAGWGDAGVIIPWMLYNLYGNKAVLENNYSMMRRWVEYVRHTAETGIPEKMKNKMDPKRLERNKYLLNTNYQLGDWLTPSLSFDYTTGDVNMSRSALQTKEIVPTCFYAYSTELLSKTAGILGLKDDEVYFKDLYGKIKTAFAEEFFNEEGRLKNELQGIYVLALKMNLIPDHLRQNVVKNLVRLIQKNENKLDTGFLSVAFILDVLKDEGYLELAYDLLFQEECPSWLYTVKMGATSIWESWLAVLPDGTNTSVSQNHYALGCVGDWMYRTIGGLKLVEPGYRKIVIFPELDKRITSAKIEYEAVNGIVIVDWKIEDDWMNMLIEIPVNVEAVVKLPYGKKKDISVDDIPLTEVQGIKDISEQHDYTACSVGSGQYRFVYPFGS